MFPSERTMENTCKILWAFAIAFLASISLSSGAIVRGDLSLIKNSEKSYNPELQIIREKREKEARDFLVNKDDLGKLEEEKLSETETIHDRREIGEEIKEIEQKYEKRDDKKSPIIPKISHSDESVNDDAVSFKSMHDVIQALMLADGEELPEGLQHLREAENITDSGRSKRNYPEAVETVELIPLEHLDGHSCEAEAFGHGHVHHSGVLSHEFFCEMRKFYHYNRLITSNLRSGFSLGPLVTEQYDQSNGFVGNFYHHAPRLLQTVVEEPHHLLILPEIIRDAVPFHSFCGAFQRLKNTFFKFAKFVKEVFFKHLLHVLLHKPRGHHHHHHRHGLHGKFLNLGETYPIGEVIQPIISSSATASATSYTEVDVEEYQRSLVEVITSLQSASDGYFASGIHPIFKSGAQLFSLPFSFNSFVSRIPALGSYLPIERDTVTTTSSSSSSASSSAGGAVIGGLLNRIAPIQSGSSSASSSASSTTTTVTGTRPILPVVSPSPIVPLLPITPTAPIVSYSSGPLVSDVVIPEVLDDSVIGVSSPSVVFAQENPIVVPEVVQNTVAIASSSAAASSVSDAIRTRLGKHGLHKFRSNIAPAIASASSSSSASASSGSLIEPRYRGLDLNIDRGSYPFIRQRVLPSLVPSSASAASSAASSSASTAGGVSSSSSSASSSASSFSRGFNFALPREQVIRAIGSDYLVPGDVVTVTLKNKSVLFGRVLDAVSPISFDFLRPKLFSSALRSGGRVWKLFPRDFRDLECIQKFNDPLLLGAY